MRNFLDKNRSQPVYRQLADRLITQINDGTLQPGDKLPSEKEMMQEYQIGRLTIRNALAVLENEGYITKLQGVGSFCNNNPKTQSIPTIEAFLNLDDLNYFSPYLVKGISSVLTSRGYHFTIHNTQNRQEVICSLIQNAINSGVTGIILQPTLFCNNVSDNTKHAFQELNRNGIPYIFVDHYFPGTGGSYVVFDEKKAGEIVAQHLGELGHKKVAIIYDNSRPDLTGRKEGFCEYAAIYGIQKVFPLICPRPSDNHGITENNVSDILSLYKTEKITAVFCHSDFAAVGLMYALKDKRIKIPKDISIVGVDDALLATACSPCLTSVRHPKDVLASTAATALLDIIEKKVTAPFCNVFIPTLVVRESSASPQLNTCH